MRGGYLLFRNRQLHHLVAGKLEEDWFPRQIPGAGLKKTGIPITHISESADGVRSPVSDRP
jgi:hypothetical protein